MEAEAVEADPKQKKEKKVQNKTWTDQPDELLNATKLGAFSFTPHTNKRNQESAQVEIRSAPSSEQRGTAEAWYITAGNLFGSQTVKCDSAVTCLLVLCTMGVNEKLPTGAELMENAK